MGSPLGMCGTLDEAGPKAEMDYWATFADFERPMPMEADDMQLGHLLTHGHAIHLAQSYASRELIEDFELSYRKRLFGLRCANNEQIEKSALPRKKLDPRTKQYWGLIESFGDMHGHAIKYAYSFLDLRGNNVTVADLEAFGRILWPRASTVERGN